MAATASADFSTRLWNALTGDEVHQFQHSHIARTVAFARRSPRLLSAGTVICLLWVIISLCCDIRLGVERCILRVFCTAACHMPSTGKL